MRQVLAKVTGVSVESGCLRVAFDGGYDLFCAPPAWMQPAPDTPPSCAVLAVNYGRLVLVCPNNSYIVFGGFDSRGELETSDLVKKAKGLVRQLKATGLSRDAVKTAVMYHEDIMIFNPLIPTVQGEPSVCRLYHETGGVGAPLALELEYGEVFFHILADEILGEALYVKVSDTIVYPDKAGPASNREYLCEWEKLATSPDIHGTLKAHFAFLATSDESNNILSDLLDQAEKMTVKDDALEVTFKGNYKLICGPPADAEPDEDVPESCRLIAKRHRTMALEGPYDAPLVFPGLNAYGELPVADIAAEAYLDTETDSVKLALWNHQDQIVYCPVTQSSRGEAALSQISHASATVVDTFDADVAEVLLRLMACDVLEREILIPVVKKPEVTIGGKTVSIYETELDLSDSGLREIPAVIGMLTELEELELSGNQLRSLPPEIGKLTKLRRLDLARNQLAELPETIAELEYLEELYIQGNPIAAFPQTAGKLNNLKKLMVDVMPLSIGQLENLEEVWAENVTAEAGELENLKDLRLKGRHPQPFPDPMPAFSSLTALSLMEMDWEELPIAVCELTSVKYLYVTRCKNLTRLPPQIGNLVKLRRLCLNGCNLLAHLPEEIQRWEDIRILEATHTALTAESFLRICGLKSLESLNLRNVPLTELPSELGNLQKLTRLDLDDTNLQIPPRKIILRLKTLLPTCEVRI